MADQPMPKVGTVDVTPIARAEFLRMLLDREAKGLATYGTRLQTNNGRNVFGDLLEELIDAWQYSIQALLEHADLTAENARLRAEIAELRGQP